MRGPLAAVLGLAGAVLTWAFLLASGPTTLEPGQRYRFTLEVEPGVDPVGKAAIFAALQGAGAVGVEFHDRDRGRKTQVDYTLAAQEARTLKRGDVLLTLAGFELRFVSARKA